MTADDRTRKSNPPVAPLPSRAALDAYFLEARCRLLDLAAILDRIGRGPGSAELDDDPRLMRIRQALEVLHDESDGRAERIQQIFSLDYDPSWERPQPR
jgi:hypothetical protein